ncbi:SRPBCC domain-containing protein [Corynebacterium glyciniphilum]|uniref:SRPBCC family protein n=1 Tax=Corynebacterium glyciniphilum TaxID=1404244 RepID=UPI002655336C|nr:SRPBCC domain-containing protein [Corynebacterium glyciniphilum]MDN6705719.1 SRPBCC domain-containing protein [Corynebacterium glyciniphilum]
MNTRETSPDKAPEFTITRTFDVPRELVWRAWTDPHELAAWFDPFGVTTDSVTVDLRVGGRYSYTMVNDTTGEEYPTGGEYLQITPVERLVFTWGEPDAPVDSSPVVTLTFSASGDRDQHTEMVFHLRGIGGRPGDNYVYDGWDEALTNLGRHLESR